MSVLELFCAVDDFCRSFEPIWHTHCLASGAKQRNRARELALSRMQAEAETEQAEGIVGAQVKESSHGWGSHVIEYFAVGTAVKSISTDHTIQTPTLILPLTD